MSIKSYINTEYVSEQNDKLFESLGFTTTFEKEIASKMLKENIECTSANESVVSKMLSYMTENKSLIFASDKDTRMVGLLESNNDNLKPMRFVVCENKSVYNDICNAYLNEGTNNTIFPLPYVTEYNNIINTVKEISEGKRCDITLSTEFGKKDLVSLLCNEGKKVSSNGNKLKFFNKSKDGSYVVECVATVDNADISTMSLSESNITTDNEVIAYNHLLRGNLIVTKDIENGVAKSFSSIVTENKFISSYDDNSNVFGMWSEISNGLYEPKRFVKVDNAKSYNTIKNQIKESVQDLLDIKNIAEHNIVQSTIKSVSEGKFCNIELTKRASIMELVESLCRKGFKIKHEGNKIDFYEKVDECGDIIPMCSTVLKLEEPENACTVQDVCTDCDKLACDISTDAECEISTIDKILCDKDNEIIIKDWELQREKSKLESSYLAKDIIDNNGGAEKFLADMSDMLELYNAINNDECKEFNYDLDQFEDKKKTAFKLIKALFSMKKKCTQIKFGNVTINIK